MNRTLLARTILVASIAVPALVLAGRGEYPMLTISGIIAAILAFFTVLIRGMLRKGARSAPELYGRTMTFWWMLAGFLVAVATPKIFAFLLMGGLCWLALQEYFSLLPMWRAAQAPANPLGATDVVRSSIDGAGGADKRSARGNRVAVVLCYAAIPIAIFTAYIGSVAGFLALIPAVAVGLLPLVFVLQDQTADIVAVLGFLTLGLLFFVFDLGHGLLVLNLGVMVLVFCFFLTELRDLVSYWVGKGLAVAYARSPGSAVLRALNRKIAPAVSPNKAWGAGIFSILFVSALAALMAGLLPDFPLGRVSRGYAAGIGFVIGWLGLLGDLVFSMVKRDIGVKDSGSFLPGGTGVIDRIDSLVFTIPATFHLIYWKYFL